MTTVALKEEVSTKVPPPPGSLQRIAADTPPLLSLAKDAKGGPFLSADVAAGVSVFVEAGSEPGLTVAGFCLGPVAELRKQGLLLVWL